MLSSSSDRSVLDLKNTFDCLEITRDISKNLGGNPVLPGNQTFANKVNPLSLESINQAIKLRIFLWFYRIHDIFSNCFNLSPRFKNFGKIRFALGLIYGLSNRIQAAFYFPQSWVQNTGLIFYSADFHGRNWRIPGFYENKNQH